MKRLIMLAVLCAFVLGAASAQAADLKAGGVILTEALWADNFNFADGNSENIDNQGMIIAQRGQMDLSFIANENLKGVMQLRYSGTWGQDGFQVGNGDNNSAARNDLAVRQVYMDFNWPDTAVNVKAGYQSVSLPAAVGGGSFILDEEVAAALVSGPITDNVSYLLGYARVDDASGDSGATSGKVIDSYVAALPLNFEGLSFAPFFMYTPISGKYSATDVYTLAPGLASLNASDANAGEDTFNAAYWLGTSFSMNMFDPFVLKGDLNYGAVTSDVDGNDRSGWLFDLALEYTGMDFMTPEVFFAYTSGEDGNGTKGDGNSERMPVLAASSWAVGSFFFGGSNYNGEIAARPQNMGFWTLGASLKDIQSFAEGLSHTFTVLYAQGTNDKNIGTGLNSGGALGVTYGQTLTEEDALWEVDFNTAYQVYDELTLTVELGYLNLDADEDVWGDTYDGGDAYKVTTGLTYQF